jgi:hypothetical protein
MKTKVFLTGLALLALTFTGSAQSKKNGPGTGVCDGTGPKVVLAIENAVSQLYAACFGVKTPAATVPAGDGVCDCIGVCICDPDQIKDQLMDKDRLIDKDQLKSKDGTCFNK